MKGIWRPDDRAAGRYHYVPVDASPDGFRVTLSYDRGAGVLDLGVFDPFGRFRGYSGGARDTFVITPEWATPGYLPGEVPVGQWSVLLGLHRVPAEGLPWEITVSTPGATPSLESPPPHPHGRSPRRELPDVDGLRWYAGDLHAHTVHSDGTLTIDELAALAASSGLDFLAVTDHNTVSHHPYLASSGDRHGVTLLPGQEVTTDRGHANAFGDIGWVDFRRPASEWRGLLSINHPLAADCAWRQPVTPRPRLAEVWHSGWWDRTWGAPLAWLLAWDPGAAPVGGSDYHNPAEGKGLGQPTTWVLARSSEVDDLLEALAAGRTAISESPGGSLLLRVGDEFVAWGAEGLLLAGFDGRRQLVTSPRWSTPAEPGLHWLEDGHTRVMAIAG